MSTCRHGKSKESNAVFNRTKPKIEVLYSTICLYNKQSDMFRGPLSSKVDSNNFSIARLKVRDSPAVLSQSPLAAQNESVATHKAVASPSFRINSKLSF